jgi:predicted CoA-binding protein
MTSDAPSDDALRAILSSNPTIAVVGASPKPGRVSRAIMGYLLQHGYHVVPVNPAHAGETIFGQVVRASLADVPEPIDIVDIFRRSEFLGTVVDEALALAQKPKVIWMQLGLRDDAAAKRAQAAGLTVVMDRCIKIEHGRLGL